MTARSSSPLNASPGASPEAEALRRQLDQAELLSISLDATEALRRVADALRLARGRGDADAQARALGIAATCHYYRGDYVSAVAAGLDSCALASDRDPAAHGKALLGVALALASVGEVRRAEQAARRALRVATSARDPRAVAQANLILGCTLRDAERYEESLAVLQRARSAFRRQADPERTSAAAVNIGHVLLHKAWQVEKRGETGAGLRMRQRARRFYLAALDSGRPRVGAIMVQTALADCEMGLGRPEDALALLEEAARFVEPRDPAPIVARLEYYRGEAKRRLGRREEAARHLGRAVEAADGIEGDDLAIQCREALSLLAGDAGNQVEAKRWERAARVDRDRRHAKLAEFRRQMRPMWDRFVRLEAE